jgi:hypothetical protein
LGALVPAAIIVIVVLVTAGGGSSKHTPPPPAKLPSLPRTYANNSIGVTGRLPVDWTAVRGPGFVRMTSRDSTSEIIIAAPNTTASAHSLVTETVAAIRRAYGNVTEKAAPGKMLGGLPARSEVVYTTNKQGVPIRILVAAARGPRLRYILEAFTNRKAPLHDLVETQQIVLTLRLVG